LLAAVAGIVYAASSAIVMKDIAGKSLTFFSETNARSKTVLFIFVLPDCPICNSYVPELKRIRRALPKIEFYRVYADPDMTTAEARQHSNECDFGFPGLLDPAQQLVRKSGATRTPEAAVFSPDGKLLYRGRIDDRYVTFGKNAIVPGSAIWRTRFVPFWKTGPPDGRTHLQSAATFRQERSLGCEIRSDCVCGDRNKLLRYALSRRRPDLLPRYCSIAN